MRYLWIVASFLLSSCATIEDKGYKGSDAGYALISVELDHKVEWLSLKTYEYLRLYYKNKESQDEASFSPLVNFYKNISKEDGDAGFYEGNNLRGQVTLMPLKPGEYVISRYQADIDGGARPLHDKGIHIPFIIKPNQITYLGNYYAVEIRERRLFINIMVDAYFVVSDKRDRDFKLAKLLRPDLNFENMNLSINIPEVETALNPKLLKQKTTKFDEK